MAKKTNNPQLPDKKTEDLMRLFANLMLDRIFEDKAMSKLPHAKSDANLEVGVK